MRSGRRCSGAALRMDGGMTYCATCFL